MVIAQTSNFFENVSGVVSILALVIAILGLWFVKSFFKKLKERREYKNKFIRPAKGDDMVNVHLMSMHKGVSEIKVDENDD